MRRNGNKPKKNKSKTRPVVVAAARRPKRTPVVRSGLDAGALAHARLLKDPCNAPLAGPVYSGSGTGQFRRFRVLVNAEGSSVEGCYVFQLGTNTRYQASHVAGTAGSTYTFDGGNALFTDPVFSSTPDTSVRCVAGCVKVRYIGAEHARSGSIGLLSCPSAFRGTGVSSNVNTDQTSCPMVLRTGEVQHEVKFIPNSTDEDFREPTRPGTLLFTRDNSCLVVTYRGTPAASIVFEVTAVYEVENSQAGVVTAVTPSSTVTLNQLLRALGPAASWAYSHVAAPTIRAIAGNPSGTAYSIVGSAARAISALAL